MGGWRQQNEEQGGEGSYRWGKGGSGSWTRSGKVGTGLPTARRVGVLGGSSRRGLVELMGTSPGGCSGPDEAASSHPFLTPYAQLSCPSIPHALVLMVRGGQPGSAGQEGFSW